MIATHGNTDFDALAAAVAARKLYPDAVVCLSGSLNRNVREFHRLHAEELPTVDAARLELDSVRRLIVVETVHASRLGELEAVALDPAVEKVVFDHHAGDLPGWVAPENTVVSVDGALTTTHGRHPCRARARRHSARGDAVRARDPRGHGLAHVSDGDPARRRGARVVPAPRRPPAAHRDVPAQPARRRRAGAADGARRPARDALRGRDRRARRRGVLAALRGRDLGPRPQGRRADGRACPRAAGRDGRPRLLRGSQPFAGAGRRRRSRRRSAAAGTRRRRRRSSAARSAPRGHSSTRRSPPRSASRSGPARSCPGRRASSGPTRPSPPRCRSASAMRRAGSSSWTTGACSAPPVARISTGQCPTGSRTRRSRRS